MSETTVKIEPAFDAVDPDDGYDDARFLAADERLQAAVAELVSAGGSSAHVEHAVTNAIDER
jgi:hypothetical protein